MCDFISTEKDDALRRFFVEVNTDAVLRINFLANPIDILEEAGLTLSPAAENEVRRLTKTLIRKVPDLALIPTEYKSLLEEIARSLESREGENISRKTYEDDPMMLD